MRWQNSITLRLSLAFALLATLIFAALGIYLSRSADAHMTELDAHELMAKLALTRRVSMQEKTPAALNARLSDALLGEHGVIATVDSPKGPIFRWPEEAMTDAVATASTNATETPMRLKVNGGDFRIVASSAEAGWGETVRLVVARDIRHHTNFLNQLQRDFWLAVIAAALLTMIVGVIIARRGMRPVRAFAAAAGQISAGQLAERLPEDDVPPELTELVSAFNGMLGRLEESFQRLSDFSADLAHELRTPIHSLRMQTEVSLSQPRNLDEYRDLLASNLEEYERLSRIIADMLFLAKADHGLITPQQAPIRLDVLGQRLVEYYGVLAENISLELKADPISIVGDPLMLERAIGNLLINAIHHTPTAGQVKLRISAENKMAVITVSNSGQAIAAEALAGIFDRFVRLHQNHEGSGLGLAITRSIITAHGGTISVQALPAGTRFSIRVPLA